MKICPRCNKTFADDNLNFCLDDGSGLKPAPVQAIQGDSTIVMEPRATQPQAPASQPGWQQTAGQHYAQQPVSMSQRPKKSSKTWVWVVAILGLLLLLCGGGLAFIFVAVKRAGENANLVFNSNRPSRSTPSIAQRSTSPSATTSPSTSASTSTSSRTDVTTVDLDMFTKGFSIFATTELTGDELVVTSSMKDYYYALVAPVKDSNGDTVDDYKTDDADSRVTLRNIDNTDSRFGYGLVFHSNPEPLQQGYAFLIDTKKKRYRIVHHEPQKELTVVKWTNSPAINGGSEDNTLEARDQPDKIELYINGTMVTSIPNAYGYRGGVIGVYAGDKVKVGFRNLEIRR